MYAIALFFLFLLLVRISSKRSDFARSLALFLAAVAAKLVFLLFWSFYQTGGINLDYIQFVDERYYLNFKWGDPIAMFGNAYSVIVYGLQRIGFTYFDLKALNILATSFAIVRLYSLHDLVKNEDRYFKLLLVLGAILHIHVHYYSIFILKDALIFLFSVELFVHLVRRKTGKRFVPILLTILVLIQLRSSLVLLFGIFVFNKKWKITVVKAVVGSFVIVIYFGVIMTFAGNIIAHRFQGALQYGNVDTGMSRLERGEDDVAASILADNPSLVLQVGFNNGKFLFVPFCQRELTDIIIIIEYYFIFIYLLCKVNIVMLIRTMWPILLFPFGFMLVSILGLVTIRWAIYPYSTLLFTLILLASQPLPGVLPHDTKGFFVGMPRVRKRLVT